MSEHMIPVSSISKEKTHDDKPYYRLILPDDRVCHVFRFTKPSFGAMETVYKDANKDEETGLLTPAYPVFISVVNESGWLTIGTVQIERGDDVEIIEKQPFDQIALIEHSKHMSKLATPHLAFVQKLSREIVKNPAYFLEFPNLHSTFMPRLLLAQIMIAHAHHACEQAGLIFLGPQYHTWDHGPNDGVPIRDEDMPF